VHGDAARVVGLSPEYVCVVLSASGLVQLDQAKAAVERASEAGRERGHQLKRIAASQLVLSSRRWLVTAAALTPSLRQRVAGGMWPCQAASRPTQDVHGIAGALACMRHSAHSSPLCEGLHMLAAVRHVPFLRFGGGGNVRGPYLLQTICFHQQASLGRNCILLSRLLKVVKLCGFAGLLRAGLGLIEIVAGCALPVAVAGACHKDSARGASIC
jgi:hypothetical protein